MLNVYTQNNSSSPIKPGTDKKGATSKKPSFMAYQDPTGEFASKDLKRSLWLTEHAVSLHRLAVGLLGFVIVLTAGISLYGWIRFWLVDWPVDATVMQRLATFPDYDALHAHFAPQPLTVVNTQILPGGVEKYDAVAEVANLNPRWRVDADYFFMVDGVQTPVQHATLLAGEQRPLAFFGIAGTTPPGSVSLNLKNVQWQRVSPKTVPDPAAWQADRLQFIPDKFTFTAANTVGGASAHIISFTLANKSSYGYVKPKFYIALMSGESLTQLMPLELPDFASLEIKNIDMRSFVSNVSASDIKIFPLINVYDDSVYLPPPT